MKTELTVRIGLIFVGFSAIIGLCAGFAPRGLGLAGEWYRGSCCALGFAMGAAATSLFQRTN
jgi:hypothetical protein